MAERFLRQVPNVWDETKLLSGDPDSIVVLVRRHGTDWFVGAITAGPGRTISTPLGFLGAGTWLSDVYSDGPGGLTLRTQQVTSASTLTVAEPANGGFTARLCPATAGTTSCRTRPQPAGNRRPATGRPATGTGPGNRTAPRMDPGRHSAARFLDAVTGTPRQRAVS